MGFKCPERKGVADFLQEVTSKKDQEQYWTRREEPYSFVTSKEFAEAFQAFHVGRSLGDELSTPFDRTKSHPAALTTKKFGVSKKELLKACISREYLLMKRNSFVYIFKMTQDDKIAAIVGTVADDVRVHEIPNLKVTALRFTDTSRARIEKVGGECLVCDLALRAPLEQNTLCDFSQMISVDTQLIP